VSLNGPGDQPAPIDADTLLQIAEGIDLVLISADEVLIQFGTRSHPSQLLRDPDLTGLLGRIIAPLFDGPKKVSELLSGNQDQAPAASEQIASLVRQGILADVRTSSIEQYLHYTFTDDCDLARHTVALIGVGPVGARIARGLLEHGVGRVILLDDRSADTVWHRFVSLVPKPQAAAGMSAQQLLARDLTAAGYAGVESLDAKLDVEGIERAVASSDLIVLALEQPDLLLSHHVNRLCLRAGRPWLQAQIDGNTGMVGPLYVPPHTACFNCFKALADAATPSKDMARKHRQQLRGRGRAPFFPGLPAYVDIISGFSSLAIVHYLLRQSSFALGRVLVCNFERMLLDIEDVLRLPRCPVCAFQKGNYQPAISLNVAEATVEPPTGA
jgi:thiazole/oxazole-forming peptide maturase SagC family component